MSENPYKYLGPLAPVEDRLICVPRNEEVNRVVGGIMRKEYWSILGPRQIGKTTFLRLIKKEFERDDLPDAHFIYFNFENVHYNNEDLYQELINKFLEEIPSEQRVEWGEDFKDRNPESGFFKFLEQFDPNDSTRKIVLIFDEIDGLPSLSGFLHMWRKVFHERYHKKVLNRYSVIITGSLGLIQLTIGPNSPFNIAEVLYLLDFTEEESKKLIENPLKQLNIKIEKKAKEKLLNQISGHPQMLQHACHILVEKAINSNRIITEMDVDNAVDNLLVSNSNLDTLKQDMKNSTLDNLLRDILKGKKKTYYPFKEFSVLGAGAIVKEKRFCKIRNEVYRRFIIDIVGNKTTSDTKGSHTPYIQTSLSVLGVIIGLLSLIESSLPGFIAVLVIIAIILLYPVIKK